MGKNSRTGTGKGIIVIIVVIAVIILCGTGWIFMKNRENNNTENRADISYYADNIGIPTEKEAVIEALGEPEVIENGGLKYPDMIIGFNSNDELEKIKVLSDKYDLTGKGIRVGDPMDAFYRAFDTSRNGVSVFEGEYDRSNYKGVFIQCDDEGGTISSIEVFEIRLKQMKHKTNVLTL